MWDGFFLLLFLCIFMGLVSFLVGSLPLNWSLSPRQLRLVTALGTGVLVGTSLIVIIPEGVETLYSSAAGPALERRSLAIAPQLQTFGDDELADVHIARAISGWQGPRASAADALAANEPIPDAEDPSNNAGTPSDASDSHDGHGHSHDPHAWVGLSLIVGFILMYLIDTLPKQISTSSRPQRFSISLRQFNLQRTTPGPPESDTASLNGDYRPEPVRAPASRPSSTTVGLIIHALADGIALGASSTTTARLSFIIFIALLIHKAPAAFGLTSVLLKQGLSKRMARAHLIAFSLAAPIGALLTWAMAHILGFASSLQEGESTEFVTGVLLLFSGGTFLYVAMHTMQDHGDADSHGSNGYAPMPMSVYGEQPVQTHAKEPSKLGETLLTVTGMLVPLLTQFGHAH